jgi:hypothetical protein
MLPLIPFRSLFTVGTLCLITTGCGEPPAIRQYVVERENEKDLTSDLLRREFTPIPFRWNAPGTWKLASNDQFSLRAWTTGPPTEQARITLGQFPAHSGIPPQVQRWRRQLGLEQVREEDAMKSVNELKTKNGAGSFATVRGESETILAFILPIESNYWIFRFRGTNEIAKANSDVFHKFCESLDYVIPPAKTPTQPVDATPPSSSRPQPNPTSEQTPSESAAETPPDTEPAPEKTTTETEEAPSDPPVNTESDSDEAQPAGESSEKGEE